MFLDRRRHRKQPSPLSSVHYIIIIIYVATYSKNVFPTANVHIYHISHTLKKKHIRSIKKTFFVNFSEF